MFKIQAASSEVNGCPRSLPGIVKQDPALPAVKPLPPPPPRAPSAIFEDEEKSKVEAVIHYVYICTYIFSVFFFIFCAYSEKVNIDMGAVCRKTAIKHQFHKCAVYMSKECSQNPTKIGISHID